MGRSWLLYALLGIIMAYCIAQNGESDSNPCQGMDTCDACISASYQCMWCPYLPNITEAGDRCRMSTSSCPEGIEAESPKPDRNFTGNLPLSTESSIDAIQVTPQNITLKLRRGLSNSFNMTFRSLRNAPIDVYFLLDISSSQQMVLTTLQDDLVFVAETLSNVSTNFQMGFGAYVDKPALPFALSSYMEVNAGVTECRAFKECAPTYGFRSFQPLSENVSEIASNILNAQLSSNIDSPEGLLEALLQTASCTNETGWRDRSLHMVFMITDQGYHSAGDGRVVGIVKPNDGLCHLERRSEMRDNNGTIDNVVFWEYTHALIHDYPSVFQVREALRQNVIVPVFIISELSTTEVTTLPTYRRLAEELGFSGAQVVVFNDQSRDQILAAIRQAYEQTIQSVRVDPPNVPGYEITIEPIAGCEDRTGDVCRLQFDEDVTFRVNVTLVDCEAAEPQRLEQLIGAPFSFTTMNLVSLCQCDCSQEEPEEMSELCEGRGSLQCGICDCFQNGTEYFGDQCECDERVTDCPTRNGLECSNHGVCTTCGTCRCTTPGRFGEACHCDASSCPNNCGENGVCNCDDVTMNPACECDVAPLSGRSFFPPLGFMACECNPDLCYNENFPDELCHSEGTEDENRETVCGCSGCVCGGNLRPTTSNICIPADQLCGDNENCLRCRIGDTILTGGGSRNCTACDDSLIQEIFGSIATPSETDENFIEACDYLFEGCVYTLYIVLEGSTQVFLFDESCGAAAIPWIIAGSLVGAILLLGLLLLIILKLLLLFCDRIEYRKFTHELREADFAPHENPLYLTPQQDYENPIRRKNSKRLAQQHQQQ